MEGQMSLGFKPYSSRNPALTRGIYMPSGHFTQNDQALAMITVATCNNPAHVQLVKSVLNDSGIAVFIPDENTAQTAPYLIFAIGGIRIQVTEENVEAARAIIAQLDAASPESDQMPPAFT
jgi:hypothetical protein